MGLCTVASTWTRESIASSLHRPPPPPPTHFVTSSLCCACRLKHWLLLLAELDRLISLFPSSYCPPHHLGFQSLLLLCRLRATSIHKRRRRRCCYWEGGFEVQRAEPERAVRSQGVAVSLTKMCPGHHSPHSWPLPSTLHMPGLVAVPAWPSENLFIRVHTSRLQIIFVQIFSGLVKKCI